MKDLLAGDHMLFTELQNSAAFKSYRISKFANLIGFLMKKDAKFEIWIISQKMHQLEQFLSNLAEIWNITYTHEGKKSLFINL